jgi:hypothetical protein
MPKWEESERMTFPTAAHSASHSTPPPTTPGHTTSSAQASTHRSGSPTCTSSVPISRSDEGDHQREKLQFALAVALTRGDRHREQVLREQIAALGGYCEEPGT